MKTQKILATFALSMASSLFAQSIESANGTAVVTEGIQTSHPHRMPKLISLETAEIVESYGIGFSGGGNIHHDLAEGKGLAGTAYIGLGDVVELGYSMEEVQTTGTEPNRLTSGHIKLALLKETEALPMASIGYSSTLNGQITALPDPTTNVSGKSFDLERGVIFAGLSKTFNVADWKVGVHPSVQYITDDLKSGGKSGANRDVLEPALALTWQQAPQVMYMAELKWGTAIDLETLAETNMSDKREIETNLGVRFYLRNWLFMDAGIRHSEIPALDRKTTGIHANFSGVIPLKSIGSRMTGGSD